MFGPNLWADEDPELVQVAFKRNRSATRAPEFVEAVSVSVVGTDPRRAEPRDRRWTRRGLDERSIIDHMIYCICQNVIDPL